MKLIYDVCHNIAKVEQFNIDGKDRKVVMHRKGATRAYGPGHPLVPDAYKETGQPVFIPGDMGRCSYLLLGTQKAVDETFGSSCHGAGRVQSRKAMIKKTKGRNLYKELEEKYGVMVMAHGHASVAEEMPEAYKNATEVVDTIEMAGISRKLAKLKPIGCIKG
jgi:tRNA-splicing ligase RtcB